MAVFAVLSTLDPNPQEVFQPDEGTCWRNLALQGPLNADPTFLGIRNKELVGDAQNASGGLSKAARTTDCKSTKVPCEDT